MAEGDKTYTQKEVDDLVNGLKTKKGELEGEVVTLKDFAKKFDGIDLDALTAQSQELAQIKQGKLEKDGEYKTLYETQSEQHKTKISEKDTKIKELETAMTTTKKENAVNLGLAALQLVEGEGIPEAAATVLTPMVAITDDGKAMIGEKPASEYIRKDWAETPVGKTFLRSGNTGGGGNGGGGEKASAFEKYFDPKSKDHNLTQQGKLASSDLALYNTLKEKYKTV